MSMNSSEPGMENIERVGNQADVFNQKLGDDVTISIDNNASSTQSNDLQDNTDNSNTRNSNTANSNTNNSSTDNNTVNKDRSVDDDEDVPVQSVENDENEDGMLEMPDDSHQEYGSALKNRDGSSKLKDQKTLEKQADPDVNGELAKAHQGTEIYKEALEADAKALREQTPMLDHTRSLNDDKAEQEPARTEH